jgi:hypothetical protein
VTPDYPNVFPAISNPSTGLIKSISEWRDSPVGANALPFLGSNLASEIRDYNIGKM